MLNSLYLVQTSSSSFPGDARGRAQALADLGRAHLAMGACGSAVSYLRQALAATEGLADADEEVTFKSYTYLNMLRKSNSFCLFFLF